MFATTDVVSSLPNATRAVSATVGTVKAGRNEPRYIVMLALMLGSQPVATDLYLPALPAIAAELGNPALCISAMRQRAC